MTTLNDFRGIAAADYDTWLVLADWLADHDDERASWVRLYAESEATLSTVENPSMEICWYRGVHHLGIRDSGFLLDVYSATYACPFDAVMDLADRCLQHAQQ